MFLYHIESDGIHVPGIHHGDVDSLRDRFRDSDTPLIGSFAIIDVSKPSARRGALASITARRLKTGKKHKALLRSLDECIQALS